jgi:hypothetical protein
VRAKAEKYALARVTELELSKVEITLSEFCSDLESELLTQEQPASAREFQRARVFPLLIDLFF